MVPIENREKLSNYVAKVAAHPCCRFAKKQNKADAKLVLAFKC